MQIYAGIAGSRFVYKISRHGFRGGKESFRSRSNLMPAAPRVAMPRLFFESKEIPKKYLYELFYYQVPHGSEMILILSFIGPGSEPCLFGGSSSEGYKKYKHRGFSKTE